jgi:hypothetical protein
MLRVKEQAIVEGYSPIVWRYGDCCGYTAQRLVSAAQPCKSTTRPACKVHEHASVHGITYCCASRPDIQRGKHRTCIIDCGITCRHRFESLSYLDCIQTAAYNCRIRFLYYRRASQPQFNDMAQLLPTAVACSALHMSGVQRQDD